MNDYKLMQQARREKMQREREDKISWWILLIAIGCIALFVGLQIFQVTSAIMWGSINDTGMKAEIFTTLKWHSMLFFTAVSVMWFCFRLITHTVEIKGNLMTALIGFLFLWGIISLFLSEYKGLALYGNYDMRDATLSWMCYLMLAFIAASTPFPKDMHIPLLCVLFLIVLVNCVLGLAVFFRVNLYNYDWFANLIMLGQEIDGSHKGWIYGTISNPNYLSSLGSAIATFFMVYFTKDKGFVKMILSLIGFFCSVSVILTSKSSSGLFTFVFSTVLLLVIGIFSSHKKTIFFGKFLIALVIFGAIFGIYSQHNPHLLADTNRDMKVFASSVSDYFKVPVALAEDYKYPLTKKLVDPELTLDDPIETFATNRGYIWEETLKLIEKRPVFGYGMGTLINYFPYGSRDYFAHRMNADEMITKPHNGYLAVAYGCGIPALLAMIILFGLFFIKEAPYLQVSKNSEEEDEETLRLATWLVSISLMAQFMVNDLMIVTTVLCFIMMGLTMSLKREKKEKTPSAQVTE